MDPGLADAIDELRSYLDDAAFVPAYKYIASFAGFYSTPFAINARTASRVERTDTYVDGEIDGRRLMFAFLHGRPVSMSDLDARERALAVRLVSVGLLAEREGVVWSGETQLVCVLGNPCLIDRGYAFPGTRMPTVYAAPETYVVFGYLDMVERVGAALDLGTGSGLIGIVMSAWADRVVCTDIAPASLRLTAINARLARRHDRIEVREEGIEETLQRGERFDLVTCNPPFVPVPAGLELPGYNPVPDLGAVVLRSLDTLLTERGVGIVSGDLLGNDRRPDLTEQLEKLSRAHGFDIDVMIDRRVAIEDHIRVLARLLPRKHEGAALAGDELAAWLRERLAARAVYLTTMIVRRRSVPRVTVWNRYLESAG